jgi:deoxyribodipyrimidine photo-lyase
LNHISSTPVPKTSISSIAAVPKALTSFDPELALGKGTIAGETQAIATLKRFIANRLSRYHELRDRPDIGGTSHLSHALSHGEIHPRTILSLLPDTPGTEVFVKELAWREFYADVLHQNPHSLTDYLDVKFKKMRYNDPGKALDAWKQGNTGYPMVDAGLRQLRQTGWMHNRVRMIVASFLIKDLHIEWQHGADWFERNLTDFDPASNSHGWQWTAGCGTDAAPYFRIFNPVTQGLKFDPDGEYVRKYVPELRHLPGASAHEPWNNPHGYSLGYSKRIVDHAIERDESLARLAEIKST